MDGDEFYVVAFWDLNTERAIGMGLGTIPWSKIIKYGERARLDGSMVDAFVVLIKTMDSAYLDWQHEQNERERRMRK